MLVVVGCGKRKRGGEQVPAKDMYVGSLFRSHLALAQQLPARSIVILSAKYGILRLDEPIDDYEATLAQKTPEARAQWEADVARDMEALAEVGELVLVLAGADYLTWAQRCARRVRAPLAGMTLGERRAFIRACTAGARSGATA